MSPAKIDCPCCDGSLSAAKNECEGRWESTCLVCDDDGEVTFARAEHEDMDRPYFPHTWRVALGWADDNLSIAAE